MKKYWVCLLMLPLVIAIFAVPAFSQENKQEGQAQAPAVKEPAPPAAVTPVPVAATPAPVAEVPKVNELSIYGEVQSVNAPASSMSVQYYDYDNDEEKSIEITVDKTAKLDNVKDLAEIKKGDWADITYTVSAGKNIAKTVSVEKEEPAMGENAPAAPEE